MEPQEGAQPCNTRISDFWPLQTVGGYISGVLSPQLVAICYSSPRKLTYNTRGCLHSHMLGCCDRVTAGIAFRSWWSGKGPQRGDLG